MNIFEKIFSEFNKAKLKYLVVGGLAVVLHGYRRFTGDLDILLFLEQKNLMKMDKVMKKLGYQERLPVSVMSLQDHKQIKKWLKEKNMTAYSYVPINHSYVIVDILTEKSIHFKKFSTKRILKKINNTVIPVVSINDLIKMKKEAARDQDLLDLQFLENLKDL